MRLDLNHNKFELSHCGGVLFLCIHVYVFGFFFLLYHISIQTYIVVKYNAEGVWFVGVVFWGASRNICAICI